MHGGEPDEDDGRATSPFAYDVQTDFDNNPNGDNPIHTEPGPSRPTVRTTTRVNRRINTCQPCQSAKRGCNRQRPCQHCVSRKMTDKCKYASDASEPVDYKWVQTTMKAQDNLLKALYNSLGVSSENREAIAQSDDPGTLTLDLPILAESARRRLAILDSEDATPTSTIQVPAWHMTVYSPAPQGVSLDPASRVFGANSIFINLEELLGPWSETLGLHMRAFAAHDPKASIHGDKDSGETDYVHLTAGHSELEQHRDWRHQQRNLMPLNLAYQLFVSPTLFATSAEQPALITASHVARLPPAPLRDELWNEFESMMVLHAGLNTPELKKRADNLFLWADCEQENQTGGMETTGSGSGLGSPPTPTLSFFAVVCTALAIGAQSREVKAAHRVAGETSGESPEGGSGAVGVALPTHEQQQQQRRTGSSNGSTPETGSWEGNSGASSQHFQPLQSTGSLPPFSYSADDLHNLSEAARLAHDQLDLPSSLDYIVAHTFSWFYLLHPANVKSFVSDTTGSITGGGPIGVDSRIWKSVSKVVNVARAMGLGIDPDSRMAGDETHRYMSIWEKEMRRRVWWELCYYDAYISECMGQTPLINAAAYDCQLPSDVDEVNFGPTSKSLPAPNGSTTTHNLSHFVSRCRLVQIVKNSKRYPLWDRSQLEKSIELARAYERELTRFKATLPPHLQIKGLPDTADDSWTGSQSILYPATDIMAMQACDLYRIVNTLIIRLWTPFLFPTLETPQFRQWPALACTTAASAVVTASDHVRKRFRDLRPANLGFLSLGRSVFVAGCMAATVVIRGGSDLQFIETALQTIRTSLVICKDPVVCGIGRPDPRSYRFETARVLDLLFLKAENTWRQMQGSVGSKRKDIDGPPQHEVLKLRGGYELPYSGRGVVTTSCTLRLNFAPYKTNTMEEDGAGDRGSLVDVGGGEESRETSAPALRPSFLSTSRPPPAPSAAFATKSTTKVRSRSRSNGGSDDGKSGGRPIIPMREGRGKPRSDSTGNAPPLSSKSRTSSVESLRKIAKPRKRPSQESVGSASYNQQPPVKAPTPSPSWQMSTSSARNAPAPIGAAVQPDQGYPGFTTDAPSLLSMVGTGFAPQPPQKQQPQGLQLPLPQQPHHHHQRSQSQQMGQAFFPPQPPMLQSAASSQGSYNGSFPTGYQHPGPGYQPSPSLSTSSTSVGMDHLATPFDAPAYPQDHWTLINGPGGAGSPTKPQMSYSMYASSPDALVSQNSNRVPSGEFQQQAQAYVPVDGSAGSSYGDPQQMIPGPGPPQAFDAQYRGPQQQQQQQRPPPSASSQAPQTWADFNGVGGNLESGFISNQWNSGAQ